MHDDEAQILALMAEWRRLTGEGDVRAVLELMTEDAVFLTPGNAPMGRKEFEAGFRGFAGKIRVDAQQEVKELRVSGDIAYCWSYLKLSMTPLAGGESRRREGNILTVYRKEGGRWRLARDANFVT